MLRMSPSSFVIVASSILFPAILFITALPKVSCAAPVTPAANFFQDFLITWSPQQVKIINDGQQLQLTLDSYSGSGFASKDQYLFGNIDMQIKLVPGDSAGTVTAYYLSSSSTNHDELDFEFLGNVSGEPYILQTNVFAGGIGQREQRIYLWFDPTADFHTYSVSWSKETVVFLVDGKAIRVFPNNERFGMQYPNKQPMAVYSSIWNGDQWATRGGQVKINWANAPFIAGYQNFRANACVVRGNPEACSIGGSPVRTVILDSRQLEILAWVQKDLMIYNYCTDKTRYPTAPLECTRPL